MRLSRFSVIGSLMALAFALMAILPVLAATATIDIDKDFTAAAGTFEIEIEDQDADTTLAVVATIAWDSTTLALTPKTFNLKTTTTTDIQSGEVTVDTEVIKNNQAIDAFAVREATVAGDDGDLVDADIFNISLFNDHTIIIQAVQDLSAGSGLCTGSCDNVKASGLVDVWLELTVASLDTLSVKVTSVSSKSGLSVTATETGLATGIFSVDVKVSGTSTVDRKADYDADDTYDKTPRIWAAPGETITAKYTDIDSDGDSEGTRSATIVVEANDTVAAVVSPAHKAATTDVTPNLTVDFTDLDSGVDEGSITFTIVDASHSIDSISASDIDDEETVETSAITDGFRGVVTLGGISDSSDNGTTRIVWRATADDEAGNTGQTDSDSGTTGDQDFILIIDEQGPDLETGSTATAGVWYDASEEDAETDVTKSSATSIGIKFDDMSGLPGLKEALDAGTISVADFEIDDLDLPGGTSVSNVTPLAATVYDGLKNWIFLTVQEMAPDATPEVILKSGISDAVGNTTSTGNIVAGDGQAPKLTVSVSDALDDDKTKVTITSNEALAQNPSVWANDAAAGALVATASADVEATNEWEITIDPGAELGPFSIRVTAKDTAQNTTKIGNTIGTTDWPTSKSVVFYSDDNLAAAVADPADGDTPELAVPFFITLDFSAEEAEYGLETGGAITHAGDSFAAGALVTDLDVHETVTVTAVDLDGTDISGLLDTQDNVVFTLALLDITTGDHTLTYSAEDEAGNEVEDIEVDFEVKARSSYSVAMSAGWNLVSLPGTPADTAIDSVIPSSHPATNVLSFADGAWSVATRSNGTWEGSLTSIDGLHAYWVNTTSSAPIKSLLELPAAGTANTLPTVAVNSGWNLVPVIDLAQKKQDNTADGIADATGAAYFTSISWSVAYTYDAKTRTWTRITPSNGESVFNGDGVWVWATRRGTLIP